jgi:hypothetical protein
VYRIRKYQNGEQWLDLPSCLKVGDFLILSVSEGLSSLKQFSLWQLTRGVSL